MKYISSMREDTELPMLDLPDILVHLNPLQILSAKPLADAWLRGCVRIHLCRRRSLPDYRSIRRPPKLDGEF